MPDEPRPQTDAIDAAVRAIDRAEEFGLGAISFRNALTGDPIRDVATLAVQAAEPLIRRQVAEEIARAIEVAEGNRCPECGGKAASKKWARNPNRTVGRCGGGHTWEQKHSGGPVWFPAAIAREIGERHA